jgi:phosphoribosyl-ATP pyrophosphohydrolase
MKIQSKGQTKKTKEENIETWLAKKSNIKKTLMGGQSAIDMHGTWHPIPFDEDWMAW